MKRWEIEREVSGLNSSIAEMEAKAKAMIKQQIDPGKVARATGLNRLWIELLYLGGRRRNYG
jgi:hypothetical protein